MSDFWAETVVYLDHVRALLAPGSKVKAHDTVSGDAAKTGSLDDWTAEELGLLVVEGQRTLDRQASDFDRVRTTAQILLPTATALLVIFGSELVRVKDHPGCLRWLLLGLWVVGTVLVLLAGLGAASVLSVRGPFGAVLPTLLSQQDPPVLKALATSYSEQAVTGENTVGTRLTIIRDAVTLFVLGGLVYLVLWVVRVL